jgi:hypothetical protein
LTVREEEKAAMSGKYLMVLLAVIVITFIVLFRRRFGTQFGSLAPDARVRQNFEAFEVKPVLTYYTSGAEEYPTALIGVDKRFVLESTLWKKQDLSEDQMRTLVLNMQARVAERDDTLHGYRILDNRGAYLGEWYSIAGIHVAVKMGKEKTFTLTPPSSGIYSERG